MSQRRVVARVIMSCFCTLFFCLALLIFSSSISTHGTPATVSSSWWWCRDSVLSAATAGSARYAMPRRPLVLSICHLLYEPTQQCAILAATAATAATAVQQQEQRPAALPPMQLCLPGGTALARAFSASLACAAHAQPHAPGRRGC